jgi:hypothetical protein
VHQAFRGKFSGTVPVENQDFLKRFFNLNRAKPAKQRISKMSNAPQIRPAGRFEQRGINRYCLIMARSFSSMIAVFRPTVLPLLFL